MCNLASVGIRFLIPMITPILRLAFITNIHTKIKITIYRYAWELQFFWFHNILAINSETIFVSTSHTFIPNTQRLVFLQPVTPKEVWVILAEFHMSCVCGIDFLCGCCRKPSQNELSWCSTASVIQCTVQRCCTEWKYGPCTLVLFEILLALVWVCLSTALKIRLMTSLARILLGTEEG